MGSGIFFVIFILGIVYLAYRNRATKNGKSVSKSKHQQVRELLLFCLIVSAGYCGAVALLGLPANLLHLSSESAQFACKIITAVLLILIGLPFKGLTRMFLMVIGVVMLVFALPFVFTNLGSIGAFILIALALAGLIAITVIYSHREKKNG